MKQYLTSKGNHKWYSTALRKMTAMVLLKHGKNNGITVYVHKEDYFEGDGSQIFVSQHFLFDLDWELSTSTYTNLL
jgi:hypothetical protein